MDAPMLLEREVETNEEFGSDALLSPDEFLALPDAKLFELIDGHLVERNMGLESSGIACDLSTMINNFVKLHRLGRCFGSDGSFVCFPDHPKMVRFPDVSFIARDRLPDNKRPLGHGIMAPDLVVEVISPNDNCYELDEKIALYRSAGVRLIWVIHPASRSAMIHRLDGTADEVSSDGLLDGEDVLPGFTCRIAELFE